MIPAPCLGWGRHIAVVTRIRHQPTACKKTNCARHPPFFAPFRQFFIWWRKNDVIKTHPFHRPVNRENLDVRVRAHALFVMVLWKNNWKGQTADLGNRSNYNSGDISSRVSCHMHDVTSIYSFFSPRSRTNVATSTLRTTYVAVWIRHGFFVIVFIELRNHSPS